MIDKRFKILKAYERLANLSTFYDGMMTNSSFIGRLVIRSFWQLSDEKYNDFVKQALSGITKDFQGRLLEVPIGTGIISLPLYKKLTKARIIGVDYSESMLLAASKNLEAFKISNVNLIQGDVGNLSFESESFDTVISIDGFHVFPDKQAAYDETYRVLKSGGTFCGCMYVKGQNQLTDFFVRNFCERFNYFTPPQETFESLNERLCKMYRHVNLSKVESFAGFVCQK